MKQKITLEIIGKAANISTAAVSMILTEKKITRFSVETVEKVNRIAKELGYITKKQNPTGKYIILVCPSMINPYYATLIHGMETYAHENGYWTMVYNTYNNRKREEDIINFTKNPYVSGVIFGMIPQNTEIAQKINESIPVVAVGDRHRELDIDTVEVNNYNAGRTLAKHLFMLGHKHISYISTPMNVLFSARVLRYEGLRDEFIKLCPTGTVSVFSQNDTSINDIIYNDVEHQTGFSLTKQCLKEDPDATALVGINDMVAYGIIDSIIDSGFSIPEDYSVCGFDNIYPSRFYPIQLTTIEYNIREKGQGAVQLLVDKITHQEQEDKMDTITRVEYKSKLVKRTSTSNPKGFKPEENESFN